MALSSACSRSSTSWWATAALRCGLLCGLLLEGCLIAPDDAECGGVDRCEVCLATSGCGWCPGTGCVPGTSLGPESGLRCRDDYRFFECAPSEDPCRGHRGCDACLAASCVWCDLASGGSCSGFGDGCPDSAQHRTLCPAAPADCSDYSSCSACNSDPGCQWEEDASFEYRVYCDVESCGRTGSGEQGCFARRSCG